MHRRNESKEDREGSSMKIKEVIGKILEYHPQLPGYRGCDDYKCGDPEAECTGIVTALAPNVDVIRKTIELGANLIVVHEPTFFTSEDGPGWFENFPNSVYEEKRKLLDDHGIVVWRDHDHMHFHNPDGIFTGVLKYLGWEKYAKAEKSSASMFTHFVVTLPMSVSLSRLADHLMDKIGMNGVRYIGNPEDLVSRIAIVGHLYPMFGPKKDGERPVEYSVSLIKDMEEKVDVLIPGETIDWTILSYIRDAVSFGRKKAMISLGHFNWEELGMKYAKDWISELVGDELRVTYVPAGDMYRYQLRG